MRVTLIHPCIGRRAGQPYIKTWQMEPLPPALIAGLTPTGVELSFVDDRIEPVPFECPTDLAAISVETYTARRAYQIASEYRARGVPVVMGGFHATLCPEEVAEFAEAVVVGEAEHTWPQVLEDAARGTLRTYYRSDGRVDRAGCRADRSIYAGKRYLALGLVEATRGCRFNCEFCSIQTVFRRSHTTRPLEDILAEVEELRDRALVFFVDDNLGADLERGKEILQGLIPLNIRWVSQVSINAAHDEEFLDLMRRSGCRGVLIGLESLNPENLRRMNKAFNLAWGSYESAVANLYRHGIRLYVTFMFGYDEDTMASFADSVRFAVDHRFFIAGFNHLTPFPGTPLYHRLEREGRLIYDRWWLDGRYGYNMIPFRPARMTAEQLETGCLQARAAFYSWRSIVARGCHRVNRNDPRILALYAWINYLMRREVRERQRYPLGDESWRGEWIRVRRSPGSPAPLPADSSGPGDGDRPPALPSRSGGAPGGPVATLEPEHP